MVQFFTENQFSLLKAIAKDSIVAQPTSGKFIKEHKLSGASSVKAASRSWKTRNWYIEPMKDTSSTTDSWICG